MNPWARKIQFSVGARALAILNRILHLRLDLQVSNSPHLGAIFLHHIEPTTLPLWFGDAWPEPARDVMSAAPFLNYVLRFFPFIMNTAKRFFPHRIAMAWIEGVELGFEFDTQFRL
jgi:hypothetical protein